MPSRHLKNKKPLEITLKKLRVTEDADKKLDRGGPGLGVRIPLLRDHLLFFESQDCSERALEGSSSLLDEVLSTALRS